MSKIKDFKSKWITKENAIVVAVIVLVIDYVLRTT